MTLINAKSLNFLFRAFLYLTDITKNEPANYGRLVSYIKINNNN